MMALRPGMYVLTPEQFQPYREAFQKQIPKRPYQHEDDYHTCPNCDCEVMKEMAYCQHCGQKISWRK